MHDEPVNVLTLLKAAPKPPTVLCWLQRLDIDRRIFLRGEGANVSVLYFPLSLTHIYGNRYPSGNSQYAFGPGFINFNGGAAPLLQACAL